MSNFHVALKSQGRMYYAEVEAEKQGDAITLALSSLLGATVEYCAETDKGKKAAESIKADLDKGAKKQDKANEEAQAKAKKEADNKAEKEAAEAAEAAEKAKEDAEDDKPEPEEEDGE